MAVVLTRHSNPHLPPALCLRTPAPPVIEAARKESNAALAKLYSSYMLRSLVYAAVFLGPVATISLMAYPAWETQYLSGIFDNTVAYNDTTNFPGMPTRTASFSSGRFLRRMVWQLAGLQVGAERRPQEAARALPRDHRDRFCSRLAAISGAGAGLRLRPL